jgi:hypothetical protein
MELRPGVILIDQLQQVYIDGELEPVDTTNFLPKMMRRDYSVGLNLQGGVIPTRPAPKPSFAGAEAGSAGRYKRPRYPKNDRGAHMRQVLPTGGAFIRSRWTPRREPCRFPLHRS